MPRFFAPIEAVELAGKIGASQRNVYDYNFVRSDFKVEFDFENVTTDTSNCCYELEGLLGYNTLDNGMTFFGVSAGGDWEIPVFFVVYWDGKKLRAYIPTDGNPWNTDTKQAYGNADQDWDNPDAEDDDVKNLNKLYGPGHTSHEDAPDYDKEKIIADIKARILPKV
ncbi:MAG: hypothetical protein M0R80_01820 [Proteobacteria bacterium]|jgi:hypothetical protein|nr:hypothetical protein [Pseudomonadota bacterium]